MVGAFFVSCSMDVNEQMNAILSEYGEKIVEGIKYAISGRKATGKTEESLSWEAEGNVLTIYGAHHLTVLDSVEGRGATVGDGSGSFYHQILEWVQAKGIDEAAAYPIYVKINREGWSSDGLAGTVEKSINDNIAELNAELELRLDGFIDTSIESIFDY